MPRQPLDVLGLGYLIDSRELRFVLAASDFREPIVPDDRCAVDGVVPLRVQDHAVARVPDEMTTRVVDWLPLRLVLPERIRDWQEDVTCRYRELHERPAADEVVQGVRRIELGLGARPVAVAMDRHSWDEHVRWIGVIQPIH